MMFTYVTAHSGSNFCRKLTTNKCRIEKKCIFCLFLREQMHKKPEGKTCVWVSYSHVLMYDIRTRFAAHAEPVLVCFNEEPATIGQLTLKLSHFKYLYILHQFIVSMQVFFANERVCNSAYFDNGGRVVCRCPNRDVTARWWSSADRFLWCSGLDGCRLLCDVIRQCVIFCCFSYR